MKLYTEEIRKGDTQIKELGDTLFQLERDLETSLRLDKKIPKNCKIKDCPFRKGILDENGKKVNTRKIDTIRKTTIPNLEKKKEQNQKALEENIGALELCKSLEEARGILSQDSLKLYTSEFFDTSNYGSFFNSLNKIKIIDVFTSIKKKCDSVEDYIYGKNELENLTEKVKDIDSKISYLKNNSKALKQLHDFIENSDKQVNELQEEVNSKNEESLALKQDIMRLNNTITIARNYFEQTKAYEDAAERIDVLNEDLEKFKVLSKKYNIWKNKSEELG